MRSTRTPRAEALRFAVTMAGICALLGLWLWLRKDHPTAALATAGTGALLVPAAALLPALVLRFRDLWMMLAHALGRVNATILLTVFYFLVLTPIGLVRRALRRRDDEGAWTECEPRQPDHFRQPY